MTLKFIKKIPPLLLFSILIAIVVRLLLLNIVPIGVSNDELDYLINAKAIALTGKDISGTWSPFSLKPPPFELPKGEIPYLLISPFFKLFPMSLVSSKIPFILANLIFLIVMYLFISKLLNKKIALISSFVIALNPWNIYYSRTAYEAPLALLFYFIGIYALIFSKGKKIFISIPFFILGFYSYIATKLILLPLIAITIYFANKLNKAGKGSYLIIFLSAIFVTLVYAYSLKTGDTNNRVQDVAFWNSQDISRVVNAERTFSIKDFPLTKSIVNKYSIYLRDATTKYTGAFSIDRLFINGEKNSSFSLANQGYFYYIDLIFFILGFTYLFSTRKIVWAFLVSVMLIAPIPSVISSVGVYYTTRSSLMMPVIIIFIASGVSFTFESLIKRKILSKIIKCITIFTYAILTLIFLTNYISRHPIYGFDTFNFNARIISKYIDFAKKDNVKIILIDRNFELRSSYLFKQYLFYSKELNPNNIDALANVYRNGLDSFSNIKLDSCEKFMPQNNSVVIVRHDKCPDFSAGGKKLLIASLADTGEIYSIYDDYVCSKYNLSSYPRDLSYSDFNVEKLSEKDFCEKFISIRWDKN